MHKLRNFIFILMCLAGGAPLAYAQSLGLPDPIQYVVAPETPGPNQAVQIEVQGTGTFLGDAQITWTQDWKVVLQGAGARDYAFTTGALGSQTHIQVKIVSPTQGSYTHDFIFLPSAINLIWEADTSVPPLYRGKALYSAGSAYKVVAFPSVVVNGTRISSNSLSFQWSRNDDPLPQQSGLGKSIISLVGDQLQPSENVAVDVYYGASKVGHGEASIPVTQPSLLLYVKDPLRGVLYDSALPQAISLAAKEITIQASPFFFANSSKQNGSLEYTWALNDSVVTGPNTAKGLLTLRQTGSGAGATQLAASLQNNDGDKLIQGAQAAVQIIFGQQSSSVSSFFGL